jgi:DUF1680 family protein
MIPKITSGFWHDRLEVNARRAIFHQWKQLEASGCVENFRIAAGDVDGFREGWFFADSDAYKWLDAASRIYASFLTPQLATVMDALIALLARAQMSNGYLFTYNQIHFPDTRWVNLQIEHELYCHGHLIEAGVSHFENTARTDMLDIARHAADRIVEDFFSKGTDHTPGHEEIEIALLRLHQVTNHKPYLEMARQFIEQRGRNPLFALSILRQNSSADRRGKFIQQKKQEYLSAHPEFKPFQVPPGNAAKKPDNAKLRWYASALSGKYFQQHVPVRKQTVPVGHSVRFAYLETAIAMLARESGDRTFIPTLERAWEHMVTRRMYVTGGIGSLPDMEGFGNDYELDPEYAYAETCAALASIFWNWEMAQLTGEAKYSDLLEWQLYNAAAVGMGLDGTNYFYNNPLTCRGGVTRKPWYAVPCCPSNLSRTWAGLGKYIYSSSKDKIHIHQYISSEFTSELAQVEMRSNFPWDGRVDIKVNPIIPATEFTIHLRLPSWSVNPKVKVNGEEVETNSILPDYDITVSASSYDPRWSRSLRITRIWNSNDEISLVLNMPIIIRSVLPDVKGHAGKVAITRGPLVYCLENIDHPDLDIFTTKLGTSPFTETFDPDLLGGTVKIIANMPDSKKLTFIPYHLWGNRGESTMTVWINE